MTRLALELRLYIKVTNCYNFEIIVKIKLYCKVASKIEKKYIIYLKSR
jgi:hypothetical protein